MRRALAAVVAAVLALGGCESVPGQPTADMTMWELIQRSTNPDGTMSLPAAKVRFSYLFEPLPGVTMPVAKADPPGFRVSGTTALNAMIAHWSELTNAQRDVVAKVITPPKEPPRFRADNQLETAVRAEVENDIREFGNRTGYTGITSSKIKVVLWRSEYYGNRAWTHVLGSGEEVIENDTRHDKVDAGGPAHRCETYIPPSSVANGMSNDLKVTIAHEVFHCFQGFLYPDVEHYRAGASWVHDGYAEFAATEITGAAFPTTWPNYLSQSVPLFDRADSAMGWWSHLQYLGHDSWKLLTQLWLTGVTDSYTVYKAVHGNDDDVYDTWAASRLRQPGFGDDWEVHGVGVPGLASLVQVTSAQAGAAEVFPLMADPVRLDTSDVTGIVRINAANPMTFHDNAAYQDKHITEGDYCLGEKCTCPKDTERAGLEITPVQGPLWVALPGGEAGNELVSDVVSLEDYCRRKPPERKKTRPHDQPDWARPHGPAHNHQNPGSSTDASSKPKPATTGDPHVTRLDGTVYDFQAAGEFTLVRSDSGDLEVQTRQEPWVRFDGTRSDTATMNTAVAAKVAGDRVAFYAGKDKPEARVNGKPVTGDQTLPHGGTIFTVDSGYGVRWPDGTELWAVNTGGDSLNVLFGPPANVKLHGLIGPELVDRAGRKVTDLYKEFGESWRIRQEDSLFDYAPGQSTATFTRRDIPTKRLTLADLSPEQRAAGEKACDGVPKELHDQCVFDVAVSGNNKFAVGYRTLDKLTTTGGGGLKIGQRVGPTKLEAGQQQTFTIDSDADALYFASDADCTKATSATVYWRITMPDGHDTLQVPMCADPGRQTTTKHGTWKIDVWVAPGADQGGLFALHVAAAGALRGFNVDLPKSVDGTIQGAGAEDRYKFAATAGQKVTLTAKGPCEGSLEWGLESPDGNRVTLKARACEGLGQQTIPTAGTWAVTIYNRTKDESPHAYAFTVG